LLSASCKGTRGKIKLLLKEQKDGCCDLRFYVKRQERTWKI